MGRFKPPSRGRLTENLHLRLTNEELEFIQMISEKTGLSLSEATRLAINMFRITLGLEAVDVDKVGKALRQASEKVIEEAKEEGWYEDLKEEEEAWKRFSALKKSSERKD
ncbi:MAG: hypothetical protein FGF53_08005 [Candidatus Brockarchaeota archaeon]|nr:hypothetical protein [Candidatus Brockarchaeota archaeon]